MRQRGCVQSATKILVCGYRATKQCQVLLCLCHFTFCAADRVRLASIRRHFVPAKAQHCIELTLRYVAREQSCKHQAKSVRIRRAQWGAHADTDQRSTGFVNWLTLVTISMRGFLQQITTYSTRLQVGSLALANSSKDHAE